MAYRRSVVEAQLGQMREMEMKAIGWIGVVVVNSSGGKGSRRRRWVNMVLAGSVTTACWVPFQYSSMMIEANEDGDSGGRKHHPLSTMFTQ